MLLDKEPEREWLRPDLNEKHIMKLVNVNYDDSTLKSYPVSRDIFSNDLASDRESILEAVEYSELNTLF